MLIYITDSKKTKHAIRVEGIQSIAFENNPAVITFNYLNGSKKELHMVDQDFKVPSNAYVVDKLWAWVSAGLAGKPKQLTSFLGKKAQVEAVKSTESNEEHSENQTYLRISKFHDSFVEKQVIPVDDITSITAHSKNHYDYLLFTTKHKKYKLILVYTYNDVYASDINDSKHAANLIKDDIVDLIKKAKTKSVLTYNPIEFVSLSYEQPYAEEGNLRGYVQTWDIEKAFDFSDNFSEIEKGKIQETCLYAYSMWDVIEDAHGDQGVDGINSYKVDQKSFIQLGSTRTKIEDSTVTNVSTMPPLGFTYDLLGQENLEGSGKWLGQWAPSKAYYSIQGYNRQNNEKLDFIPENAELHNDVLLRANIDTDNTIPPLTKWNLHEDQSGNKFFTFWDDKAKEYKDISVDTGDKRYNHINIHGSVQRTSLSGGGSNVFSNYPNMFNPVYGMLCKEDGVYKVSVNFEDILLTDRQYPINAYDFLPTALGENVEAYLTIKIQEGNVPGHVIPFSTGDSVRSANDIYERSDFPTREHTYGPFLPSERGFNIKSDFIIPGVKDYTFFKFLLTVVNKNTNEEVYVTIDSNIGSTSTYTRNVFGSSSYGWSREIAAKRFTNSVLTQTWSVLDDDTAFFETPNSNSISLLHIEKIAELPSNSDPSNDIHGWMGSTSETTESGEKVLKSLKGVSRTETTSGYYYNGVGIGTSNL